MNRKDIYRQIDEERERQDAKWGGPVADDLHSVDEWGVILLRHLGLAMNESTGYDPSEVYRRQLVRVAATAIAAIESLDRRQGKKLRFFEGNEGRDPGGRT